MSSTLNKKVPRAKIVGVVFGKIQYGITMGWNMLDKRMEQTQVAFALPSDVDRDTWLKHIEAHLHSLACMNWDGFVNRYKWELPYFVRANQYILEDSRKHGKVLRRTT